MRPPKLLEESPKGHLTYVRLNSLLRKLSEEFAKMTKNRTLGTMTLTIIDTVHTYLPYDCDRS